MWPKHLTSIKEKRKEKKVYYIDIRLQYFQSRFGGKRTSGRVAQFPGNN